jgi:hypothetical protein
MKLRLSPSLSSFRIAAAFRSISEDLHDDVDELCESRRESFRKQMQLLSMITFTRIYSHTDLEFLIFLTLKFILKISPYSYISIYIISTIFSIVICWNEWKDIFSRWKASSFMFVCAFKTFPCAFIVGENFSDP